MNTVKVLTLVLASLGISGRLAMAQTEYPFTFKATCYQTNAQGKIVSSPISDHTILRDLANAVGVTDLSGLAMVYHEKGNAMGDTIDIINPTNGAVLNTVFGFYFGEAYGRIPLTSTNGARRLDYVYTSQNTRSLGTALITKNITKDGRTMIQGQMRYLVTPTATNTLQVCNGTFICGSALSFTNSP
jgi:hypothetical protein